MKNNLKNALCDKLVSENKVKDGDVIRHSYTSNRLNNGDKNMSRIESQEGLSPTLDTRCDCLGICVQEELFEDNEIVDFDSSEQFMRNHKEMPTLIAKPKFGIVEKDQVKLVGGIGEMKSNSGTQYYEQNRIYDGDALATSIPAESAFHPYYQTNLKIRKLTPKECLRLMGFTNEDYKALKDIGMSDAAIYHLAGDSIVVPVLISIFSTMLYSDDRHKTIVKNYIEKEIVEKGEK